MFAAAASTTRITSTTARSLHHLHHLQPSLVHKNVTLALSTSARDVGSVVRGASTTASSTSSSSSSSSSSSLVHSRGVRNCLGATAQYHSSATVSNTHLLQTTTRVAAPFGTTTATATATGTGTGTSKTATTATTPAPQQRRTLAQYVSTPGLGSVEVLKPDWTTPKKEGDHIPNVTFVTRVRTAELTSNPFDWKRVTTYDLFAGKRVVVFALPGAFTPTCSTTHVPGYEQAYDEITQELELDEVYCISVNDAFVMRQWGLNLGLTESDTPGTVGTFQKVKLLPDGAAQFTRGMGMSNLWDSERGFGERSWRYSMVVNDCVIEKMLVEPGQTHNSEPDPFQVSDATTMVEYLRSSEWNTYDE